MNSRERVLKAINHEEPDRVPVDLGGTVVSGIMASALVRLREHLGLDRKVKVIETYQMLGEVAWDLVEHFDIDVLPVQPESAGFEHIPNRDYKPFTLFDGTDVLVPGVFDVTVSPDGDWLMHEACDPTKPVIARMPKDGYYFDKLDLLDDAPDFTLPPLEKLRTSGWRRLTPEVLEHVRQQARTLREATDKALVLTNWGEATLGPPRIGSFTQWLVLMATEPEYVDDLMSLAAEIALDNLKLYWDALGDTIDVIFIDGYDYGTQAREMFSPAWFERFHGPCYKRQCDWIHQHTPWKIAKHCDGSITRLIEPMIQTGIDILNPIQTSAAGMDARWLKETFGDRLTFWGGGVETQSALPFGTPEEVRAQVAERLRILAPGGGLVWATIHNIQCDVPPENIVAAFDAAREFGAYPIARTES